MTPNFNWTGIPEHMRESVRRYVERGIPPGGFLTALFSGARLTEVVGSADDENQAALISWARFLHNEVPSDCQGTPESFEAWIKRGGLIGREAA